jgi:predicted acyl esterase
VSPATTQSVLCSFVEKTYSRRRDASHPLDPLTPGKVTPLEFDMPDLDHTFRRGHRIMVQVQSSWFPLTDREK